MRIYFSSGVFSFFKSFFWGEGCSVRGLSKTINPWSMKKYRLSTRLFILGCTVSASNPHQSCLSGLDVQVGDRIFTKLKESAWILVTKNWVVSTCIIALNNLLYFLIFKKTTVLLKRIRAHLNIFDWVRNRMRTEADPKQCLGVIL